MIRAWGHSDWGLRSQPTSWAKHPERRAAFNGRAASRVDRYGRWCWCGCGCGCWCWCWGRRALRGGEAEVGERALALGSPVWIELVVEELHTRGGPERMCAHVFLRSCAGCVRACLRLRVCSPGRTQCVLHDKARAVRWRRGGAMARKPVDISRGGGGGAMARKPQAVSHARSR